ncbi:hypothetical protein GCK72_007013 [Caenorhabditis remanei]|uniref:Uncharacterized protein n=1 Tax=Caenorhabditis remanei TaxID=31234 RepID=A0A6A5HHU5_CAERE|nr:hypothetical protein GCK72_007013 [Caenorhabditis remanei]KAF1767055.1 hypothetical protein GCK72_007013 [Caenorhabditis remanei]
MQNGHFFHPYRMQQQQQYRQPGQGDWNAFHQRQMQVVADPMPMPDFNAQRRQEEMDAYVQRQEERIRKLLEDQRVKDHEAETQRLRSNAIIATQNNEKAELQKKNDELHRKNADLNIDLGVARHRISDQNLKINAYEQKFGILESTEGNSSSLPSVPPHHHRAFPSLPSTSDNDIIDVPVNAFDVVVQSWRQWWSIHEKPLPGVDVHHFVFDPRKTNVLPQRVEKPSSNLNLYRFMFKINHKGDKLRVDDAWAQLSKEERLEWRNHCETLKMWQIYQIQHGWIVHKRPTVKKEVVTYDYPA